MPARRRTGRTIGGQPVGKAEVMPCCPLCDDEVLVVQVDGSRDYWYRCEGCGWTEKAGPYESYLAARREFRAAWRQLLERARVTFGAPFRAILRVLGRLLPGLRSGGGRHG